MRRESGSGMPGRWAVGGRDEDQGQGTNEDDDYAHGLDRVKAWPQPHCTAMIPRRLLL